MKILTTILLIALYGQTLAQSVKSGKGTLKGGTYKYYYLQPAKDIKGIVILLAGAGEKPQSVLKNTSLPRLLADRGFVTIVPELNNLLYADEYTIAVLNAILKTQSEIFNTKNVVLGGFSSGGAIAMRYSEHVLSTETVINLKGLFVVDPPLDLERVYNAGKHMITNCEGIIKQQGASIKAQLDRAFGGSPEQKLQQYRNNSSFSAGDANGGNARVLKNLPIRLYSEPDLEFVKRTYCEGLQFEDINAFDLEGLHKFLLNAGNIHCEYITTKGRGFHSWNIIEPINCAEWIVSVIK
jgi:hypothetical protein